MAEKFSWNIQEGVGVVLPLHGHLFSFQNLAMVVSYKPTELDLRIAKVHLEMALRKVSRELDSLLSGVRLK